MMIHSLEYQLTYLDIATFKGNVKWKPCLLKNERWFYNTVWWFEVHISGISSFSSVQENNRGYLVRVQLWPVPASQQMLGTETSLLQPWARQWHAAKLNSSEFPAQLYTSGLSYKWIHMRYHSNESHEKRPAFIVDAFLLTERYKSPSWSKISKGILNRRRRNFADKQL